MTPSLRKLALTAHVAFSVGWLGAVAGFLALSIAGLTSQNAEVIRASYVAMDLIGLSIIVPMSLAALASGLVLSLGTEWGLLRYYWVLIKFGLTILITLMLLLHQFTAVAEAARRVAGTALGTLPVLGHLATQLVSDAGLGLLVLLMITALSIYKPWGKTHYGLTESSRSASRSAMAAARRQESPKRLPIGLKIFLAAIGVIAMVGLVIQHLVGHNLHGH